MLAAEFVPLAALLRPPAAPDPAPALAPAAAAPVAPPPAADVAAVAAARRFAAALADALDARVERLLCELAADVLARELRAAPCDLPALVRRLVREREADDPVRVRVAPADAARPLGLPSVADPALAPGDAILECRTGTIDARLGVRLAAVLERLA